MATLFIPSVAGQTPAGTAVSRPLAGSPTCAEVRQYLKRLAAGNEPPASPLVFGVLAPQHALAGSVERPELTTIGQQVLRELELRAYRTDPLPLETVANEIGKAVGTLGAIADNAEYFLAELGSVPPARVVPFLRIAAASLACRPETPEDLVEEFKNAWGSMEVLGGSDADRLLAAELVAASGVAQESFYSPMMGTVDRLRAAGCRSALATAALLHLHPRFTMVPPIDAWVAARRRVGSDEEAALVAATDDPAGRLDLWEAWRHSLSGTDSDRGRTAAYLAAEGMPVELNLPRVREGMALVEPSFGLPALASSLAAVALPYRPAEVVDWLTKATQVATSRQLAPSRGELSVLGLAFLRGIRPAGAAGPSPAPVDPSALVGDGLPAHVALHAWLYRDAQPAGPSGR